MELLFSVRILHAYVCAGNKAGVVYGIIYLLLKDTLNKGHNTFNLFIKDKFCGPYRTMAISFHLLKKTTSLYI